MILGFPLTVLRQVNQYDHYASHVEITFRDEYLARADMWRLVVAELANKCITKGQRIVFMGTIKAQIKTLFVHGKKVRSAFFNASTKPILRSESARYVLFIQMSKEMWDFDADGTGEIMFSKVINGFLPELFKRWRQIKVRHLVTIVLFTRLEFYRGLAEGSSHHDLDPNHPDVQPTPQDGSHKDFYRVVVSDMPSVERSDILSQLKLEFKVFLKDVLVRKPGPQDHISLGTGLAAALGDLPDYVIAGRPSAATRGNILEAINLASLHFSSDYIDRDLVRTGVSIAIVTPGTGLFEVDYDLLVRTTDNVAENGIGIDLVCLSRMPLHSVPLFKYQGHGLDVGKTTHHLYYDCRASEDNAEGSFASVEPHSPRGNVIVDESSHLMDIEDPLHSASSRWLYAIPHWVDVSFWASNLEQDLSLGAQATRSTSRSKVKGYQKAFVPRVRMYELQMMGVMENAATGFSIPFSSLSTKATLDQTKRHPANIVSESQISLRNHYLRSTPPGRHKIPISVRPQGLSGSTVSGGAGARGKVANVTQIMDQYDENIFQHPDRSSRAGKRISHPREAYRPLQSFQSQNTSLRTPISSPSIHTSSPGKEKILAESGSFGTKFQEQELTRAASTKRGSIASTTSASKNSNLLTGRISRQISFGLRGFGSIPPKAFASTEISSEHARSGSLLPREHQPATTMRGRNKNASFHKLVLSEAQEAANNSSFDERLVENEEGTISAHETLHKTSRPIPIRRLTSIRTTRDSEVTSPHRITDLTRSDQFQEPSEALDQSDLQDSDPSSQKLASELENGKDLLPGNCFTPWLTILNPSNPKRRDLTVAGRLGRWQHVFPRALRTSKFKWKSLCSPAAIPFTTEDFPTAAQLARDYHQVTYHVETLDDDEISEQHRPRDWHLREMIAFRFSQGFQVVVGSKLANSSALQDSDGFDLLDTGDVPQDGSKVCMSKGSAIHHLSYMESNKIEIKGFLRKPAASSYTGALQYRPAIRTMLNKEYLCRNITLVPDSQDCHDYAWEKIDQYLAGQGQAQPNISADGLRSWRARFVLIPIDPPSSMRRPLHSINEDDEEEIRLEGIKKLSQVWQRFRYVPPDERRFQATTSRRKDPNPLDIIYQTRNPSIIVAAELDNIGESDSCGRPVQLLPESELYQRSNFNLGSLAQTIQGEKGVRMMDRRWHLRLHYNCFIGFEFTTWLLQNFKDVETRDEAVELGNDLMKGGLFQHVEQRHNFRDGNYFYQVGSDYRAPRPESRSNWFGSRRADRSVPPTPGSEMMSRDSSKAPGSHSGPNNGQAGVTEPTTPTANKRHLGVALSKSLLYDVDHRKRSYRPELINLHYDRLHNPDNCYHIRIEWMSTTSKLIEDAIVSWATSVDRFGLRLVEVPISEASTIADAHPFRAPYLVKLVKKPPGKQPQDYFDATSFTPVPQADKQVYQKAIMKKFNFVLDFEAARDFPSDVDVTYSWGKPDYQFPQYIHRSGVLLAQITDEGDFLLLANRLYNNRSAAPDAGKPEVNEMQDRVRFGPMRTGNHRGSPRPSPFTSPLMRASNGTTVSTPQSAKSTSGLTMPTAEQIKVDFESFCHDPSVLGKFYNDILSKASSPAPNIPFMEASIPALGLPPSMMLNEASPSPRSSAKKVESGGNGSPQMGILSPI